MREELPRFARLFAVLQNLRKPDQISSNVMIGLLFASCFNKAAQRNKAWFSPQDSPMRGIVRLRTNNPLCPKALTVSPQADTVELTAKNKIFPNGATLPSRTGFPENLIMLERFAEI